MHSNGVFGFTKDNITKVTYNRSEIYPSVLGEVIIQYIKEHSDDQFNNLFSKIKLLSKNDLEKPIKDFLTNDQMKYFLLNGYMHRYKPFETTSLFFLNNYFGIGYEIFEKNLLILNAENFLLDSLFCEYGYIINLDTNKLEIWKGFQKRPNITNKYGTTANQYGYYPCKIIKEISLKYIRSKNFSLKKTLGKNY